MKSRTLLLAAIVIAAMFVVPAAATQFECLGDCYDADVKIAEDVHCYECLPGLLQIYPAGVLWVNYPCEFCTCPCDAYKEWSECPECCDGVDNDDPIDGMIDCDGGPLGWPGRDTACECCLDHDESVVDKCGECGAVDCVPEAATIALVSVGILGIIGIGLRRREL